MIGEHDPGMAGFAWRSVPPSTALPGCEFCAIGGHVDELVALSYVACRIVARGAVTASVAVWD